MRIFERSTVKAVRYWAIYAHPETGKLLAFGLIHFLMGIGLGSGFLASNALLISRAGVQPLLYIYVGASLFSLSLAGIFFFLADRFPRKKLFVASFAVLGFGLMLFWAFLQARPEALWAYFFLRIFLYGVLTLTTMEFWVLASDHFNHFEARRWFPALIGAGVLGDMLGGFLASSLAAEWGAENLLLIWAWVLLLSPLLLLPLHPSSAYEAANLQKRVEELKTPHPSHPLSVYPKGLAVALFSFWLAYTFFTYGVDFLFNSRALVFIPNADELAAFFGKLTLISSAAVFVFQIFLTVSRDRHWGLDRLIYGLPPLIAAATGALHFFPGLAAAAFAEGLLYFFIEFVAASLLQPIMNLYPYGYRGRIKMLTEGLGRPLGILLLLLVVLGTQAWSPYSLSWILFGGSLAFLIFPFLFQRIYRNHLGSLLQSTEYPLVSNAVQALGEPNKKELAPQLCRLLERASSLDMKKTIVLSLGRIRSREAFRDIVGLFSVKSEALQMAVLESLGNYKNYESILALFRLLKSDKNVSYQVRMNATRLLTKVMGKKMVPFLLEGLDDPDSRARANAIESIGLLRDKKTVPILSSFLSDADNRIRANAAIALQAFKAERRKTQRVIQQLVESADRTTRLSGLYAVGETRGRKWIPSLLSLLDSPDKKIREHAATALAKMRVPEYREAFLQLLMDPDSHLAIATARHIGRFPGYSRMILFEGIADLDPSQRSLILKRLEKTPLDFSVEKTILLEQSQRPVPLATVLPVAF